MNIISSLKDLHHHCMLNESLIDNYTKEAVNEASAVVGVMLHDYTSFFEVKAMNNFTMRSYPFKLFKRIIKHKLIKEKVFVNQFYCN